MNPDSKSTTSLSFDDHQPPSAPSHSPTSKSPTSDQSTSPKTADESPPETGTRRLRTRTMKIGDLDFDSKMRKSKDTQTPEDLKLLKGEIKRLERENEVLREKVRESRWESCGGGIGEAKEKGGKEKREGRGKEEGRDEEEGEEMDAVTGK